jgi:hypothetical protein
MDKTLDRNKRTTGNFFAISATSSAYFILSFLFVYLIGQLSTAIAAMQFDYTCVLFYYKLVYTMDANSWMSDSVKLLFSMPPVISLFVAVLSLIAFMNMYTSKSNFKLFFLWSFVHGIVWFFGALVAGMLLDSGFGYVILYFYFQDTGKLILSLLSLAMMLAALGITTKWFVFSANSYFNQLNEHSRTFFMLAQVFVPIVVGTIVLVGIKLPKVTIYELFVLLATLLAIIPIGLIYNSYPTFFFDEEPVKVKMNWGVVLIAILALVAFRVLLGIGIPFGSAG